jgi:formylglycine-generating enzyme required for sulfatase activity
VLPRPDASTQDAGAPDRTDAFDDALDSSVLPGDAVVDMRGESLASPCGDASCTVPPSCAAQPSCGPTADSCCASPLVPEGTFLVQNASAFPRTISSFRLDRYEVTVGRFRTFVSAVVGGWLPLPGAGKHVHLANGGLRNMYDDQLETGWNLSWNSFLPKTKNVWDDVDHLACGGGTWTQNAGANEKRPIGCVNWYQAYAFCIWDGGFLPSFTERNYAACGGNEQRPYPWGTADPDPSRAQYCTASGNNFCGGRPPFIEVGSKSAGDGLFGQADLAGNVWEWILDNDVGQNLCKDCFFLNPGLEARLNPGGGVDTAGTGLATSLAYQPDATDSRASEVGFRCARSP